MSIALRSLTADDLPRLRSFWEQHWAGDEMVVHGEVYRPEQVEGFVTEDWTGVVTYLISGDECEIISLDSLREQQGTGSALIHAVVNRARERGCRRLLVSTTNDNLHALGFYQRRGFQLAAIRRDAVTEARKRKPRIPLIGENSIPIRDEIELDMELSPSAA